MVISHMVAAACDLVMICINLGYIMCLHAEAKVTRESITVSGDIAFLIFSVLLTVVSLYANIKGMALDCGLLNAWMSCSTRWPWLAC